MKEQCFDRGRARPLISPFPSVTNSPTVRAWSGNGWTEDDPDKQSSERNPVLTHMVLCADTAACLSYHLLTTLLISYVFACGINNVYLEKSMCIIVFDLTVNFKARDSIFFFFLFFFLIFKDVN